MEMYVWNQRVLEAVSLEEWKHIKVSVRSSGRALQNSKKN